MRDRLPRMGIDEQSGGKSAGKYLTKVTGHRPAARRRQGRPAGHPGEGMWRGRAEALDSPDQRLISWHAA
jgi:hypothetical protein